MSHTYRSFHYETIASIQDAHFWFRARNRMIEAFIRRTNPSPYTSKSFLEIGCGTGIVLQRLEQMGFACTGLDVNAQALVYAAKRTKGKLVRQSIFTYKPKDPYDVIGAFDVMEHIRDDERFLKSCASMLAHSGMLYLTVPAGMWLWSDVDIATGHIRRYEKKDLMQKLMDNGFRVKRMVYWNTLLLPLYALWHHHSGLKTKDVLAYHVQKMPRAINTLFLNIFLLEEMASRYLSFPFGATLVVCAEKI